MDTSIGLTVDMATDKEKMTRLLSLKMLPIAVAEAIKPWLGVVDAFPLCPDQVLRTTVASAITNLRRRVIVTDRLEIDLERAQNATVALAGDERWIGVASSSDKDEAIAALNSLIIALLDAKPNGRAKGLGLDW